MALRDIWNTAVDGAFKGGKWGMIAGGGFGAFAGLGAPPEEIVKYMFGPFGSGAVFGVKGAALGMLAGAAIGAVVGAVVGAFKTHPHPKPRPAQEKEPERARTPELGMAPMRNPALDVEPPQPPAPQQTTVIVNTPMAAPPLNTTFQDMVKQSRGGDMSITYRGGR